jgi:hypothetical protein
MNDRAVSDIVGYVLVFSLIIATVGVVTTVGFGTLSDRQTAERINNVERAFDVFATNMEDVYRDGAPSRATEMRLAGGELRHGDPVRITIADANENKTNVTISPRPLIYADGDTEIVYVAGAVIRSEPESAVMIRNPPFYAHSEGAVFPLIETFRTSGPSTVSTDGTVRVTSTARGVNTSVSEAFEQAENYTITVESPRSDAWMRYFESADEITVEDHNPGVVEAKTEAGRVTVPRFGIRLRFSE